MVSENKISTRKLTELGMLTAVALIVFIVEQRLPNLSVVPGMKLGLANIVTVYAIYQYKPSETALIVFARIILGSVFAGNMEALLYSISGSVFCLAGMIIFKKIIPEKYLYFSSIVGALFHNTGQTLAAMLIMHTTAVIAYFPFLVISGTIAGLFTGICAQLLIKKIKNT